MMELSQRHHASAFSHYAVGEAVAKTGSEVRGKYQRLVSRLRCRLGE